MYSHSISLSQFDTEEICIGKQKTDESEYRAKIN